MFTSNFTILSAELSTLSESENRQRTETLKHMLDDLNLEYIPAQGCYKGTTEQSFVVSTPDVITFNVVANFAFNNFAQESVLYVDGDKSAHLMYGTNFKNELLGTFNQVNPKLIESLDAYTIIDNTVYSIV